MRTFHFLPAALLIGMTACNNAGDKAASSDTTKSAGQDSSMQMAPKTDSSQAIAALPAVPAGQKCTLRT